MRRKQLIERWKTDYDFKTFAGAVGSLFVTAIFALYNGFLGVYHSSLWHGTICVYYIVLVAIRAFIVAAEKKLSQNEGQDRARSKVYIASAVMLLILNVSLIVPIALMVKQQKPVGMTLIPAIAIAAYTTYKIVIASVNMKKKKTSSNSLVKLLRTISFIDALVSVLTLQNTLIMVHSKGKDIGMIPLTSVTSGAVWAAVLLLSVAAIAGGVRKRREDNE